MSRRFAVVVGRSSGGVFYLSGSDGYYGDIVRLLGGVNVNSGLTVGGAALGLEGLRKLMPEVIVEVRSEDDVAEAVGGDLRDWWRRRMKMYSEAWSGAVVVLDADYASVPGPRYIDLAERLADEVCVRDNPAKRPD
jgi:ABC-type Fe3+-hydroxamate transport system substrate-binding protein